MVERNSTSKKKLFCSNRLFTHFDTPTQKITSKSYESQLQQVSNFNWKIHALKKSSANNDLFGGKNHWWAASNFEHGSKKCVHAQGLKLIWKRQRKNNYSVDTEFLFKMEKFKKSYVQKSVYFVYRENKQLL